MNEQVAQVTAHMRKCSNNLNYLLGELEQGNTNVLEDIETQCTNLERAVITIQTIEDVQQINQ